MNESKQIAGAFKSEELNAILANELAGGNVVDEISESWPTDLTVWLQKGLLANYAAKPSGLRFQVLNDPHYWFEEVSDLRTKELLVTKCTLGGFSTSLLSTGTENDVR